LPAADRRRVTRGFGFPGADEVGNMHQFYHDFNEDVCRIRDVGFSRSMNPALQTIDRWLEGMRGRSRGCS
jgi:hypothetical protein